MNMAQDMSGIKVMVVDDSKTIRRTADGYLGSGLLVTAR